MIFKCLVCLAENRPMYKLSSSIKLKGQPSLKCTILEVLEKVVSAKVGHHITTFSEICKRCINQLKIAYNFITHYNRSQKVLIKHIQETEILEAKVADVIRKEVNPKVIKNEITKENLTLGLKPTQIVCDNKNGYDKTVLLHDKDNILPELKDALNISKIPQIFLGELQHLEPEIKSETEKEENVIEIPKIQNDEHLKNNDKLAESEQNNKNKTSVINEASKTQKMKRASKRTRSGKVVHAPPQKKWRGQGSILENDIFPCRFCQKVFDRKIGLQRHLRYTHEGNKDSFTCEICGHTSENKSRFNYHKATHTVKKFTCEICKKHFMKNYILKSHMLGHKNERKHLCNICGKGFNYANALEYHLKWHNNEKAHVCAQCGAKFTLSSGLIRHIRTHTGERPYKCSYCEKSFPTKGQKRVHEYCHTGENPYHCKYCQKGFKKTYNLNLHLASHDGPHKCTICGKSFIEFEILSKHYKRIHKEDIVDNSEPIKKEILT